MTSAMPLPMAFATFAAACRSGDAVLLRQSLKRLDPLFAEPWRMIAVDCQWQAFAAGYSGAVEWQRQDVVAALADSYPVLVGFFRCCAAVANGDLETVGRFLQPFGRHLPVGQWLSLLQMAIAHGSAGMVGYLLDQAADAGHDICREYTLATAVRDSGNPVVETYLRKRCPQLFDGTTRGGVIESWEEESRRWRQAARRGDLARIREWLAGSTAPGKSRDAQFLSIVANLTRGAEEGGQVDVLRFLRQECTLSASFFHDLSLWRDAAVVPK